MGSELYHSQYSVTSGLLPVCPFYVTISTVISFGGLFNGLDTGTISPVTVMTTFQSYFGSYSPTLHGLIVSCIFIPAAMVSLFTGKMADRLGRPKVVSIGALALAMGTALEAAALHLAMFFVGRILVGLGQGLFMSTVVVYICEISPPAKRGLLTGIVQLLVTIGILVGYFTAYGTVRVSSSASWRAPFACQSLLAFIYASACWFLPESPRWLALCGQHEAATQVWDLLEVSTEDRQAEDDMSAADDNKELKSMSRSLLRAFRKDVRARTALGTFILIMQQFCGIDCVLYYAPLMFKQTGLHSNLASFLASGIMAVIIVIVTIPGFALVDRWKRRSCTILGGTLMAGCMILIGSLYASKSVHSSWGPGRWIVIITIYLYIVIYCVTWAVIYRVYPSEIQPPVTRAAASSLGQSANWLMNFTLALIIPIFFAYSSFGPYYLFGFTTFFNVGVCITIMPETRGRALECINDNWGREQASSNEGRLNV